MYGSIAQGVGDEYSDIEFWLFFAQPPEPLEWCERIAPSRAVTVNEFGSHVVFFEGLVRGEFHFATTADLPVVSGWPSLGALTDDVIVLDRRGALRPLLEALPERVRPAETAAEIAELCLRFANWIVLATNVSARGEVLRADDALGHARRHLTWMARLATGATETWLTPSRRAETELPSAAIVRLHDTLAANPDARCARCGRWAANCGGSSRRTTRLLLRPGSGASWIADWHDGRPGTLALARPRGR